MWRYSCKQKSALRTTVFVQLVASARGQHMSRYYQIDLHRLSHLALGLYVWYLWNTNEHKSLFAYRILFIIMALQHFIGPWSLFSFSILYTQSVGKGNYTRALCQKNEGSVKTKQRPVNMGGRNIYRTLSPKRAPFQIGIDWWSHLEKVPRRRRISHTYPVWLWGCSPSKIPSPGPVLHGTEWLLWRPHIQSPTLHSRCGINKGLIKRGSAIDQ
jgi:hypothetical protein